MSHFTVLVIGNDPETQLEPFQENNCADCPEQFLEFNDTEDENLNSYETEGCTMVRCPDGSVVYPWDERFRIPGQFGVGSGTHAVPKDQGYEEIEVPHKTRFATFEEYMADYCGSEKRDAKKGRYGYWENPNAKWDWYSLGGRWTGFLKLKPGKGGKVGRPGVQTDPAEYGWVDQARAGDVDWEGMRAAAVEKSLPNFDRAFALVNGRKVPSWDEIRNRHGMANIDAARDEYRNDPVMIDLRRENLDSFGEDPREQYAGFDRDKFIARTRRKAVMTFAVLKDGKWFERGSMGWWGCVSDEKDVDTWEREYAALLEALPPNTLLSVYDCHI